MRRENDLYFSPSYRFNELNFADKDALLGMFYDRVYGFYLIPAQDLCDRKHAFAAGVMCCSTIDFLAKIEYGDPMSTSGSSKNFKKFLENNIGSFSKDNAQKFYTNFRCGLVHGGKIDSCGQFSYDFAKMIKIADENNIMIVNPNILLENIIRSFEDYIRELKEDDAKFNKFQDFMKKYFNNETK